ARIHYARQWGFCAQAHQTLAARQLGAEQHALALVSRRPAALPYALHYLSRALTRGARPPAWRRPGATERRRAYRHPAGVSRRRDRPGRTADQARSVPGRARRPTTTGGAGRPRQPARRGAAGTL